MGGTCDFSSSKLKGWSKCEKPSETGRNYEAIWGSSPRWVKTGEKRKDLKIVIHDDDMMSFFTKTHYINLALVEKKKVERSV